MKERLMVLLFSASISLTSLTNAQDFQKMAGEMQKQYKEEEAVILTYNLTYKFNLDNNGVVKVEEDKTRKLLSLRYNEQLFLSEYYDGNSAIEKFYGESSLKQKASDLTKFCATYTSEGLFYDDSKFCSQILKLKEIGEVWDVRSIKRINDVRYLTTVYIPEDYTTLEKKIRFVIPQDIEADLLEFNFEGYDIVKTQKTEEGNNVTEFVAKKIDRRRSEPFSRGAQHTYPHVLVRVKSFTRNGKKTTLMNSTQDMYAWYQKLVAQLSPNQQLIKETVQSLTAKKSTDEEKIKAIYYWVQDNIRYIAFEDGLAAFKPDEAHKVFEKRYGDCKGMANLMKEMLRVAGYDARLTWIGTSRIRYDQSLATLAANNHMICALLLGGKKYFLDATEKYVPFGENAERIQGRPVLIENGNEFILETIPIEKNPNKDERAIEAAITGSSINGTCSINLDGETRKNFLYRYHYTQSDKRDEFINGFIGADNPVIKSSSIKLPNLSERSGQMPIECQLIIEGAVSTFNDEMYIDIDPIKSFKTLEMKSERQSDIDFGQKVDRQLTIALKIPDGYSVSFLPPSLTVDEPEFKFKIDYKREGNKIIYLKKLVIPEGIIRKKDFTKWNAAIDQLNKSYENQISLKKQK